MSDSCSHATVLETEEYQVCADCGLVLGAIYGVSYSHWLHSEPWKNEETSLNELADLLRNTCRRCQVSLSVETAAFDMLQTLKRNGNILTGKKHSCQSKRNVIFCAYALFLSFCKNNEPRNYREIESMFSFRSRGIDKKEFWRESKKLDDLLEHQECFSRPSHHLRKLLACANMLRTWRIHKNEMRKISQLADDFAATGNYKSKNVMLAVLCSLCSKHEKKELLESSFVSNSTIFRLRKKIQDFERL